MHENLAVFISFVVGITPTALLLIALLRNYDGRFEDRKLFLDQFKGKALQQLVLIKGETKENIQAITGATISSRAVTNGVRDAVQMLVDKYGSGVKSAAVTSSTSFRGVPPPSGADARSPALEPRTCSLIAISPAGEIEARSAGGIPRARASTLGGRLE